MVGLGTWGLPSPARQAPDPPQVMVSSEALERGKEGFMWGFTALRDAPAAGVAFILAGFLFPSLSPPLGDLSHMASSPLQGKTVLPPPGSQRAQESCCWCHFEQKACGGGSRVNPTRDSAGGNSVGDTRLGPHQFISLPALIRCLLKADDFCFLGFCVSCHLFGVY